ncbi:gamma-glutamyl-phosphate reductase, partial [Streptomyces scabiei]
TAPAETRNRALTQAAAAIRAATAEILAANAQDVAAGRARGLTESLIDRLTLTPARIEAIARAVDDIAALPDPVGSVTAEWTRPNGL